MVSRADSVDSSVASAMPQTLPRLEIAARLQQLRQLLQEQNLDGFWVPSADEHLNEYLLEYRKRRQWITGFTGSVGDALISRDRAWLWVDPRYHEQAEREVDPNLFTVIKGGLPDQPSLMEIVEELGSGFRLGVDPFTVSVATYRQLQAHAQAGGVLLVPVRENPLDKLAKESSQALLEQPIYPVPAQLCGATPSDKLAQVRQEMRRKRVGLLPLTKLDQVAWLLNLRGSDIPYNPVFRAYALVALERVALFTDLERLTPSARQVLAEAEVELWPYEAYPEQLPQWAERYGPVGLDPKQTTQGTQELLHGIPCRELDHPVDVLKAVKNPTELEQMRLANRKASRAKIRTLAWIDRQIQAGIPISEADVAATLEAHYREEGDWVGLSFNTIAGAGANSSIVHYGTPDPQKLLQPGELFLLDSGIPLPGGHYRRYPHPLDWLATRGSLVQAALHRGAQSPHSLRPPDLPPRYLRPLFGWHCPLQPLAGRARLRPRHWPRRRRLFERPRGAQWDPPPRQHPLQGRHDHQHRARLLPARLGRDSPGEPLRGGCPPRARGLDGLSLSDVDPF
jgi:Xaa-Pro aminopeptidase